MKFSRFASRIEQQPDGSWEARADLTWGPEADPYRYRLTLGKDVPAGTVPPMNVSMNELEIMHFSHDNSGFYYDRDEERYMSACAQVEKPVDDLAAYTPKKRGRPKGSRTRKKAA